MFAGELSRARQYSRENMPGYPHLQRPLRRNQESNQPGFMPGGDGGPTGTGISAPHDLSYPHPDMINSGFNPALHDPGGFHETSNSNFIPNDSARYKGTMTISGSAHHANTQARPAHDQDSTHYHGPGQPGEYPQANLSKDDQGKSNAPFIAGFAEPGSNFDAAQPYYFAANPGNSQDGFMPSGPIPFLLTQAQQVDNNTDPDGNQPPQFSGQQFILLSPALPNNSDKNGGEFDNFKPMMMPLTPIQMYPASYFHGSMQGDNKDSKAWAADPQHFVFSDGNAPYDSQEQDPNFAGQQQGTVDGNKRSQSFQGNQQQAYFQPALTPLAVMQPQGNAFFSGWLAHPSVPVQPAAQVEHKGSSQQYANATNQQKPYNDEMNEQGQYFKSEKMPLPALSQWASSAPSQTYPNQWVDQSMDQKKAFVQQASTEQLTSQPNSNANASAVDTKASLRSQMPPLAPIQNVEAKPVQKLPNVESFSSSADNIDSAADGESVKPAAISDRSKRFSRDRLVANIDSPGIFIPPLTPSLTPIIAGMHAASGVRSSNASGIKAEDLSTSTAANQASEDSVFRFPPAYASSSKAEGSNQNEGTEKDLDKDSSQAAVPNSETSENKGHSSPSQPSGYMSTAAEHGDTGILVSLSNVKPVPVLSLPTFADENSDAKPKTSESQSDQQLQTPTAVLNTPTHQLNPSLSQLSTPTHQLHTPNQALNTPTQPLNTPTQPLHTPTQVTSPLSSSVLAPSYVHSPLQPLMPAPTGKKRKAENDDGDRTPKQLRSADSENESQTPFRKPTENLANDESLPRRKQRQSSNHPPSETIEIPDDDDDKPPMTSSKNSDVTSKTNASCSESIVQSQTSSATKFSLLKRVPLVFSLVSSDNQPPTSSNPTQLNTPVLAPSSAMLAASGKINPALLRRGSASEKSSSSTPQFFTFMPSAGYSSPMFFAHIDPMDPKFKQTKGKAVEGNSDDSSEKVKCSPMKRAMTLNLSSKSLSEDGLQTPSKIPVVTPSAILSAGVSADVPQMFNFQDLPATSRNIEKRKNAEKESNKQKENDTKEKEVKEKSGKKESNSGGSQKFRLPSLVVDPPSDSEDSKTKPNSSRSSASPNKSGTTDSPHKVRAQCSL